jgi:hypothetical protein
VDIAEQVCLNRWPFGASVLFKSIQSIVPILKSVLPRVEFHLSADAGCGRDGKAYCFEDQYLSTGGQLYELMMGHDCYQADLRPLLRPILEERGWSTGLCCHPYDLCTELIARESGVLIADESGKHLAPQLNLTADVTWIGYANGHRHNLVEPLLRSSLQRRGLLRHIET